jgi:D-serine dehydratase
MPFDDLDKWTKDFPLLGDIIQLKTVTWINDKRKRMEEIPSLPLTANDMYEAEKLWHRFAPFLAKAFPETQATNGIIESPLREIDKMKQHLNAGAETTITGKLFLKCDNELPIAGSIKARGGIYEVLHHAEALALQHSLIQTGDNYECFADERFKKLFQQYSIGVGSTGNLGLSIGIISAKLGFDVTVYMSSDARQWKKDLLRSKGGTVVEIPGGFGVAIAEGRQKTIADPRGYFVDDETSKHLFLGYSVAALRLQKQLDDQQIKVDASHPLFVYLPSGVGGSPGGITFGLRQLFGNHVHCFFAEPTHAPSVLIGLITGKMEKVSVQDFGIDNQTEADGLAVGRPSAFASPISKLLISGIYTVEDEQLYQILYWLFQQENIFVEPSAASSLAGPQRILGSNYMHTVGAHPENITHIAWATGGALVPSDEKESFLQSGKLAGSK